MKDLERILVPIDFGPGSRELISYGFRLAERLGAQLHLLHVVPEARGSRDAAEEHKQKLYEARLELGRLPVEIPPPGMVLARVVREGHPAEEILACARENEIDLIILGPRPRTGFAHRLLGSVAAKVAQGAACPVTLLHADELARQAPAHAPAELALGQIPENSRTVELLRRALHVRATDVHIDPVSPSEYAVRFRIDGRLEPYCVLDRTIGSPLVVQLKLMSHLDIAQPFEPLEGRVQLADDLPDTEVRITTIPTCGGESVSLRLLKSEPVPLSLEDLGLAGDALAAVFRMLHAGAGLVLVTGPTGSGKTTSVHAMLRLLNTGTRNIVSIEDPVEYRVPAIRQISIDLKHGLTMARCLKTVLRMDPDVVFIGEIRDVEALDIGMRAASSGRTVFSTLHTRDVASTVTALRDLHADNLSLAGNLQGIVCQRLIRKLCADCRTSSPASPEERLLFTTTGLEPPDVLYQPAGCAGCRGSGYHGRTGVFEVVAVEGAVAEAIQNGDSEDDLRRLIREAGATSLSAAALDLVRRGVTSLAEARSLQWA